MGQEENSETDPEGLKPSRFCISVGCSLVCSTTAALRAVIDHVDGFRSSLRKVIVISSECAPPTFDCRLLGSGLSILARMRKFEAHAWQPFSKTRTALQNDEQDEWPSLLTIPHSWLASVVG